MEKPSKYTYPALFIPEAVGGYSVRFPHLDGCFTQGDTFEEARAMAAEAASLYLYTLEEDGDPIPEPNMSIKAKGDEMVVPITVWMTPFRDEMKNRAVKKTLTIPAWLNEAAERQHVNYSQILQSALKDYLGVYHP